MSADPRIEPFREAATDDQGVTLTEVLVMMVIMIGVLAILAQIFARSYTTFEQQRQYVDTRNNTAASIDMIARLLRSAQTINPDPDGNTVLDSVRVVADWNPKDGDTADAYEDVTFTTAGGTLFKREPTDAGPVPFADRVASIAFAYRDSAGTVVATPWTANQARLGYVTLTVQTSAINGAPGPVTVTSTSVRRRE